MRSRYDEELKNLHGALIDMGAMIESAISGAITALENRDIQKAKEIIADTDPTAFVCVNQTYEVLGRFVKKTHVNAALEAEQARLLREEDSISQEEQARILEETGEN